MPPDCAFRTDDRYDRQLASDGLSRYSAYLASHRHMFVPDPPGGSPTSDPVEFTIAAWSIATAPIMWPGYVSCHPRIQDATIHWDDDQRAALAVKIAVPAPPIVNRLSTRWAGWVREESPLRWRDPHDNDGLTVLSTVTIRVPLVPERLPVPRYNAGTPDSTSAKLAVGAVCRGVNAELDELLTALDTPTPRMIVNGVPR